jgi:NADP-dependent 3-hydroxy acid dehydrogenase YdfG
VLIKECDTALFPYRCHTPTLSRGVHVSNRSDHDVTGDDRIRSALSCCLAFRQREPNLVILHRGCALSAGTAVYSFWPERILRAPGKLLIIALPSIGIEKDLIMTDNIANKVVVITGASSGLGEAAARHLAKNGAKLVLGARRIDRLEALAKELTLGENAVLKTDVTEREQVKQLVDRAVEKHGRIDVLINNTGLMPNSMLENLHVEEWDRMIDVNLRGVLYGIAAALPHMKAQKSGHFINVSSVAGHKVGPGSAVYAATKHGVRVISEGLRQEVKPYNIRTTIISPGLVDTELSGTITDKVVAAGFAQVYKMAIRADSFARCVAFAIDQPEEVDINEILYRPTAQPF